MSKKIVLSFPGGRGTEIPMLYFGAKKYEDLGYEKVFINHPLEWDEKLDSLLEHAENGVLYVAGGSNDRYLSSAKLKHLCEQQNVDCYIEENVGHRMEVKGDLSKNLTIISNVLEKVMCQ